MKASNPSTLLMLSAAVVMTISGAALADESSIGDVVVTATRMPTQAFDVPAAITTVGGGELRNDALGINLSDDVGAVPGLLARNRNNYAQDQQISIRGIGANSAFGIRGVRVYQDGMPATGPDGQGQVSQFNLDSAERVEILRGPFSALYGNSSGGVIQIFTADGHQPAQQRASVAYGSYGNFRAGIGASGTGGPLDYNAAFTHFSVSGYRDHSDAHSESFNGKVNYPVSDSSRLSLIANIVSRPEAQDPLGLTPAQFHADPYRTDPSAAMFDTRKSLGQQQGGLIYDWDITQSQSVRVLGYYGHRTVEQFLSIPVSSQAAPRSAGGVVDLNRNFGGTDARWTWQGALAGRPFSWVVGLSYDRQNELRRGYNNFVGTTLGVQGNLRRDENDIVRDIDEYTQATWQFAPAWSLTAGLRRSDVSFDSQDHYITATNGDDSGSVSYGATSPVAGLMFKASSRVHLYASFGQGFQTPLGSELAYRPDGGAGLNPLRAARSNNGELGAKLQVTRELTGDLAVFEALTRNEIVVDTNIGGRSTYQNSGRSRRRGLEASMSYRVRERWRLQIAYTYIDAVYTDAYLTCVAAPCAAPSAPVAAGSRLPGVPKNDAYAALLWGSELGWHAGGKMQYVSAVATNDMNTVFTPGYATFGIDAGYGLQLQTMRVNGFVRVNNLFDRHYVGSVIVDDGNGRFFEPGPGFSILAGANISFE